MAMLEDAISKRLLYYLKNYILYRYRMLTTEEMDEIEELIAWNLSFGIPIKDTLEMINRLQYLDLFAEK